MTISDEAVEAAHLREDIYSMTKSGFHEAIRQAKEEAWEEGRDAEFQRSVMKRQADTNPYRIHP